MMILGDRPMVQYSIEASLHCASTDRTLVSTDDPRVAELARGLGAWVPFARPPEIAQDHSSVADAVLHALDWLRERESVEVDNVVLLQPTCPFRDSVDVDAAVAEFERQGRDTLISVEPVMQHPCECVRRNEQGLEWAVNPPAEHGRQAFPEFFFINGAIYITRTLSLRTTRAFQDDQSALYVMDRARGLDINNQDDFDLAQGLWLVERTGTAVFRREASSRCVSQ